ncbi:Cof-type HAD-IIB family hydrolase [Actinotalea soli]|uniref:Cof-type HAD-IIB family hydrolase n=1 Tax=Actinotalea soli TaxID=2819234 RepID=UPI003558C1DF
MPETTALTSAELPAGLDPAALDIRLVAVDMDGTLLDADHQVHPTLWPLLDELDRRGVVFCPASGRQHATLVEQFAGRPQELAYIAENGAYVSRDGAELSSRALDRPLVEEVVATVRELAASGPDVGAVVCGKRSAYVERADRPFLDEAERYYARLTVVEDLLAVEDDVLKVAVFDFGAAHRTTAPALQRFTATHQVVVSGQHWTDVMDRRTHKGAALATLQEALGVTPAQTVVFGDYLNDVQMIEAADLSFAMANAHPEVRERARYEAPANTENGVVRTLAALLGIPMAELEARSRPAG